MVSPRESTEMADRILDGYEAARESTLNIIKEIEVQREEASYAIDYDTWD